MSIKFNAFTGKFDLVETNDPNFSYTNIQSGESVEIPSGQEMLTVNDIMVDGDLMVSGNAIQLQDQSSNNFFFTKIVSGESIVIPENRLMLFANNLMVDGNLMVNGELADAFSGVYF